ncbi:MAG: DUF1206 domain-containing protein [Tistlia sp.]|uniref:DUF1206 domain-containing protein n=1 Tax=Tistlia sp. TaxID=3057121 RepID=UPI0034A2661A
MNDRTVRIVARVGYGARGVVYLIVGGFAVTAALVGGQTTDAKGALRELWQQPFGLALLALVAAGLLAHATWRLLQALLDADDHGLGAKGLVVRASLLVSGLVHAGLAVSAVRLALGAGSGGGDSEQSLAGSLLAQPFGPYLVAAVGLAVIAGGLGQTGRALSGRFRRTLRLEACGLQRLGPLCAAGLAARGLLLAIVGLLFLLAALELDPEQAGGLTDALAWLRGQPYGGVLFLAMALGLFAFGCYSLVQARCRIVRNVELGVR